MTATVTISDKTANTFLQDHWDGKRLVEREGFVFFEEHYTTVLDKRGNVKHKLILTNVATDELYAADFFVYDIENWVDEPFNGDVELTRVFRTETPVTKIVVAYEKSPSKNNIPLPQNPQLTHEESQEAIDFLMNQYGLKWAVIDVVFTLSQRRVAEVKRPLGAEDYDVLSEVCETYPYNINFSDFAIIFNHRTAIISSRGDND